MARIIGIDYGMKRCGIAVTDVLQIAVHPLTAIPTSDIEAYLLDYMAQENVEAIVFGYATHADGKPMNMMENVNKLAKTLKHKCPSVDIAFQDEAFSSREASAVMRLTTPKKQRQSKSKLDVISAILILQRYLRHI